MCSGQARVPPRRVNWDCLRTRELTVYAAGRSRRGIRDAKSASGIGAEVQRGTPANGERNGLESDDHNSFYSAQTATETGQKDRNESLALVRLGEEFMGSKSDSLIQLALALLRRGLVKKSRRMDVE